MAEGFEHRLNAIEVYGFDWDANDWLGDATLNSSAWSATPSSGITFINTQFDNTTTSVMISVTEAGTYRVTNSITASDGSVGSDDLLIVTTGNVPSGYLTTDDAEARLWGRYRIESELAEGDLLAASSELDSMGPWIGSKQSSGQTLSFPRSVSLDGTTNTDLTVPDAILDAVALLAHHDSSDEGPAVTSESVLDRSLTYATPKVPQALTRIENLIKPYQLKVGQRVGVSVYETTED